MIYRTLDRRGPHATPTVPPGMRIVFNLSARHALGSLDQSSAQAGPGRYLKRMPCYMSFMKNRTISAEASGPRGSV